LVEPQLRALLRVAVYDRKQIADLTTWCYSVTITVEVMAVTKKARLGLYLEDERIRRQIKVAAAKRGISSTAYCAQAIKERLVRDGETADKADGNKKVLLGRMDSLRRKIGHVGVSTAELVKEGRRR